MKMISVLLMLLMLALCAPLAGQVLVGSPEDRSYQRISEEKDPEARLKLLMEFEKEFPQSVILLNVELQILDIYSQNDDRPHVIEYGEKILKLDDRNITAMMALARNYALQKMELDRALQLAQSAVDQIAKLKDGPMPKGYTEASWKEYLQATETAARGILDYVKAIRSRPAVP